VLQDFFNKQLINFGAGEILTVGQVLLAIAILLVGIIASHFLAKFIGRRLQYRKSLAAAALVIEKLIFYIMVISVALTAMRLLHIPITAFAFLGGAIAIAVGFGAQNIINNFISGWILLTEKPIRLGDVIELDSKYGRVESIGPRCTRVRRTDGIDTLVPNSKILESAVVNWTFFDDKVRTSVRVGVTYGTPPARVTDILNRVADEHDEVLDDPEPIVIFDDFGDSALMFDLYIWIKAANPMQLRKVASHVRLAIVDAFAEVGMVIAFPQRDVHMNMLQPVDVRMVS